MIEMFYAKKIGDTLLDALADVGVPEIVLCDSRVTEPILSILLTEQRVPSAQEVMDAVVPVLAEYIKNK